MTWAIQYLPEVREDLDKLNKVSVKRVEKIIRERIINGSPDKVGKPLRKKLKGCRRLRVGNIRVVYKVFETEIRILVIAVGMRRNREVYHLADKRVDKPALQKPVKPKLRRVQ